MPSQHVLRQYTDSEGVTHDMYEAQFGVTGPAEFKRWYTCIICSLDYREDKVVLQGGTAYCIPLKHYLLIGKQRQGGKI